MPFAALVAVLSSPLALAAALSRPPERAAQPVKRAIAQSFSPPSSSPWTPSTNYTGANNGTIQNSPLVAGKSFDRFIQIWLENTDFADANTSSTFQQLATQGILLNSYYAVTHPSQPNYQAVVGGDFWGLADDDLYNIPSNISTVVDLLEAKNVSWASYQESMPYDGYQGYNYTSNNYLTGNGSYAYYVRKHNPTIIYDSVSNSTKRLSRHRNFNDFAVDLNASALPQWIFVTPNLVNDAHDTTIEFTSAWLDFWLVPLLNDTRFNDNRTLIILTFDETETYTINNQIYTLLLGGAVPASMHGTVDNTYYTHYSCLSSAEGNWGLGSLGRGDANVTMANVFEPFASAWSHANQNVTGAAIPLTNLTGTVPGPLNADAYFGWPAPPFPDAVSPGGGGVFVAPGMNMSLTLSSLQSEVVNLTAMGQEVPSAGYPPWYTDNTAPASSTSSKSGASRAGVGLAAVAGALLAGMAL